MGIEWVNRLHIVTLCVTHVLGYTYQQEVGMAGVTCPAAGLDFGLAVSFMDCAAQCSRSATCRGFFYSTLDSVCRGTPSILASSTGCLFKTGTLYFITTDITTTTSTTTTTLQPGQYGDPCIADADCSSTFSKCLLGSCKCQAGYRYESVPVLALQVARRMAPRISGTQTWS